MQSRNLEENISGNINQSESAEDLSSNLFHILITTIFQK